jgi:hypothetical protein
MRLVTRLWVIGRAGRRFTLLFDRSIPEFLQVSVQQSAPVRILRIVVGPNANDDVTVAKHSWVVIHRVVGRNDVLGVKAG